MPHIIIEYSANLEPLADLPALCEAARIAAIETGAFPLGGIRVRAFAARHGVIADGNPAHAFMDVTLKIGSGRDAEIKRRAGEQVFAAISRALDPAFALTTIALSLEIREINPGLNWKRNSIHDALKTS